MPAAGVYRALWRHRLMILVLTAAAGVAAYVFTQTQPKIYQASALVRIQQGGRGSAETFGSLSSLELGQRLARTYSMIVQTNSIRARVARMLAGRVPADDISISASPVGDVELLFISARSQDPQVAALVANTATTALRNFISETGTLQDQLVVVDRAPVPGAPILPRTTMTVALAVLVALLFNGALALAREFFADRLPGIDEWNERFGKPVLATVPVLQLVPYSMVERSIPELAEGTSSGELSTHTLTGPTRWSVDVPQVRRHGR
jgi:capsular polysaccharide biosynthesis protein